MILEKNITEMSDEELTSYLGEVDAEEVESDEDFSEDELDEVEEESEDSDETIPEDSEGEVVEEEEAPVQPEDRVAQLEAELKKAREEKGGLESVLGRQGKELGDSKNKIEELKAQLAKDESNEAIDDLNAKLLENPYEATREVVKREKDIESKRAKLAELQREEYRKSNELVVKERVPNFDSLKEDIISVLKEDMVEPDIIEEVIRDPFAENPGILIQIAKRAEVIKKNRELEERLNKEQGKQDRILANVANAAKQTTITAKTTGSSKGTGALNEMDIGRMNSEEIDALYAKLFNT